jgi:hypothetical protein
LAAIVDPAGEGIEEGPGGIDRRERVLNRVRHGRLHAGENDEPEQQ